MQTHNITYSTHEALKKFIIAQQIDKTKSLCIQIFTGIVEKQFICSLIDFLLLHLPQAKIIGATTDGEINAQSLTQKETVLSFLCFHNTVVKTFYAPQQNSSEELAKSLYAQFPDKESIKLLLCFADGLNTNGERFIKAFEQENQDLLIAGGLAGDNAEFSVTYVFNEKGCHDNGAVVACFYSDTLIAKTHKSFGWRRIGKKLTITSAKENIVYTIDNIPAVEIYKKYLGNDVAKELPATGVEFPLILQRNNLDIARAVIGIDKESGALIFAGNLQEGESVQFGYGDIDTIKSYINDTNELLTQSPIESIYIYSCMARKRLMGKTILSEILPLAQIAPTSGFFTYGEFFTQTHKHELLNQTMTILTLAEDKHAIHSPQTHTIQLRESNKTINALTHLVGITTQELQTLNNKLRDKIAKEVEENRRKDQQLLQQSRLAQMGEMISMIAHQWRQPLAAIGSAANGLKLKAQLNKTQKPLVIEVCDKILFSSKHLSNTIDDFRDFYKEGKEAKEVVFSEIVQGVLNIVGTSIENKNITLHVDLPSASKVKTHANELKQVLMNLIKNAEDILLEKKVANPTIWIKSHHKNTKHLLEVSDNGGGIPADVIEHIFDPYFSTKKSKDGTGLGLYMSKTIIEQHCKGQLLASNNKDGAVFTIELQ